MLRLVLMFFVVVLHALQHGGVLPLAANGAVDLFAFTNAEESAALLLYCGCYCAVDCFVLVSGFVYFRARYRYSNLVVLWLQALFWSIVLTLAAVCRGDAVIDLQTVIHTIMSVSYSTWWFFQVYVLLFLLMPVLNAAMRALSKKQAVILLGFLLFASSVLPEIVDRDVARTSFGWDALWFSCLYLVGAFIRRWEGEFSRAGGWRALICALALTVALWGSCLVASWGVNGGIGQMRRLNLMSYSSPLVLAIAMCLLLAFKGLKLSQTCIDVTERLAPYSFGVYLVSEFWWVKSLYAGGLSRFADTSTPHMVFGVLAFSLCVFSACLFLDALRGQIFKRLRVAERVGKIEMRLLGDVWCDAPKRNS